MVQKKSGRDINGTADPNAAKECILYDLTISNNRWEKEGGRRSELWHLSSQVTVNCEGDLLSWKCLNVPADGK